MTDPRNDERRPVTGAERPSPKSNSRSDILAQGTDTRPDDAAHELVDGALVVIVTTLAGTHRRRVYLSLRAAERAIDRARDRGESAALLLCRLEPVAVTS